MGNAWVQQCDLHWWRKAIEAPYRPAPLITSYTEHYSDVIRGAMASQITGVPIVCSTACFCADQRKHQSSASLSFVRGIHRSPVDSPHKGPVMQKMFPVDDVPSLVCAYVWANCGLINGFGYWSVAFSTPPSHHLYPCWFIASEPVGSNFSAIWIKMNTDF